MVRLGGGGFELGGESYRGRAGRLREVLGPPVVVSVYNPRSELTGSLGNSRLLIGGILLSFLLLALASSVFVVRALQDQIGRFLDAARRLAKGDFKHPVPTEGGDEFALLGREFNSMSEQLEAKIDELDRKRRELEETIRRVGAAFASGLDPQGILELTLATAIDACEADSGRAVPLAHERLEPLSAARRPPPRPRPWRRRSGSPWAMGTRCTEGQAAEARSRGAHALAVPIRAPHRAGRAHVALVSIARATEFTREERELFEYLAGQASVSIENADLHETVQRQAVTDELTGLSNVREMHTALDREIERSRRFNSPLGLVMVDIDDFKQVNDVHGHQQGDQVLVQVGRVLRGLSRDIDEPARYGGEELAVITPETDAAGAARLAERMREAIEGLRVARLDGEGDMAITASFGVASLPDTASDKASLIAAADAALYRAKRAGKNRVERAGSLATPSPTDPARVRLPSLMGVLEDAIREHIELKRRHGAAEDELRDQEAEALGPLDGRTRRKPPPRPKPRPSRPRRANAVARRSQPPDEPEVGMPFDAAAEDDPDLHPDEGAGAEPVLEEEPFVTDEPIEVVEAEVVEDPVEEAEGLVEEPVDVVEEPVEVIDEPEAIEEPLADEPVTEVASPFEEPFSEDLPPEDGEPRPAGAAPGEEEDEDVLEETPEFLSETPEHDRLWFEQKPPRDFDFD